MDPHVRFTCLCGGISGTLPLAASVPVKSIACCCNICRYSTGVLFVSAVPLRLAPPPFEALKTYSSSAKVSRHFCARCGSHLFLEHPATHAWELNTGVVEEIIGKDINVGKTGLEKLQQHEFLADTIDGGISVCLAEVAGRPVCFYATGHDEPPLKYVPGQRYLSFVERTDSPPSHGAEPSEDPSGTMENERLYASCHCGGVQYFVTRPTAQSKECSADWPDLLVPYHSATSTANAKDEKWWLRDNDTKYLAGTCSCRSCRLACGYPIQAWAFVPKTNIFQLNGDGISFSEGKMKRIESSSGIFREFCGGCGATVFWHCSNRPDLIDVSVGLLRAKSGARAETWLEWWTERVSFKEDAFDPILTDAFEDGLKNIRSL